jgi:tRNA 2-thiouridine synthesizing protein A
MSEKPDKIIDCKGLSCPEPVLKIKLAMNTMQSGQVLEMIATDPGSASDVPAWARRTGNQLLENSNEGGVLKFLLKKS